MKSSVLLAIASATTAWTALFNLDALQGGIVDLGPIDLDILKAALPQQRNAPSVEVGKRQTTWAVGQTVNTTSGPVIGHAGKTAEGVSEYLGIPYAQPPIGDLRFAAPVKFNGTDPINGTSFGASCPVRKSSSSYNLTDEALAKANVTSAGITVLGISSDLTKNNNEDCLFLNVWTKPQVGEKKKAVLVWIYGGSFTSGSTSIGIYNGASIAEEQDVVIVSVNYRLSILGFPGNPAGPQNLALLDQRLAVEWVRDNIEQFGGDPARITLYGQSAGGASVDLYSYAWVQDPIAAGFIPESGNALGWGLPNSKSVTENGWFIVSSALGCGNASAVASEVLSCMRTKTADEILSAIPASSGATSILGMFVPTIDDTVVFANYTGRKAADVPMLIGNNDYEVGLWRTTFALQGLSFPDKFWTAFNLQAFTCPAGLRANASLAQGTPTWRYRYFGTWSNLAISTDAGTYHGAEITLVFNTVPSNSTIAETTFGKYIRGAWATFAKDPKKGLTTYGEGWPTWDPTKDTLVRLAFEEKSGVNLARGYQYDGWCPYANVSNLDITKFAAYPDAINASVPPTALATSTGTGVSAGTPSATGAAPAATTSKPSGASKLGMGVWTVMAVLLVGLMM